MKSVFTDRVAFTVIGSTTDMTTTETVRFKPGFVAIVTGDFHSSSFFFFFFFFFFFLKKE
jgi:hypothetical protein